MQALCLCYLQLPDFRLFALRDHVLPRDCWSSFYFCRAYEFLSDPKKKEFYDKTGLSPEDAAAGAAGGPGAGEVERESL